MTAGIEVAILPRKDNDTRVGLPYFSAEGLAMTIDEHDQGKKNPLPHR